jgi:4-amino-4-deoxy-L-arabinose transferase-like glycosyltransferase
MGTTTKNIKKEWAILTILSGFYLAWVITSQWAVFSITYPKAEYERRYSESQYVKGDKKTFIMGDGDIYTYAGIRYVEGEDPTKINFEHPPLIKYAFGLSYILFGKPNWVIIPMFFLAMFSFWYLSEFAVKSFWARGLALLLFLCHSTIYMAIPQTMLDFPMTSILLLTTALFINLVIKKNTISAIFFGISAGMLLVSKYPFPLLAVYVGFLYVSLFINKVPIKQQIISILSLISTYMHTYASYFIHSKSFMSFVKFEWWRWQWFQGKTDSKKFMMLQTIFLGKYPKWWDPLGGYIQVEYWNIYWPLSLLLYIASWINKQCTARDLLFPYKLWVLIAFCLYMIGAAEDRFLVPLIPGFALFGAQFIEHKFHGIIKS